MIPKQHMVLAGGGVLLAILAFTGIYFYGKGYRFSGFHVTQPATIRLERLPNDATFIFDGTETFLARENGTAVLSVSARPHRIIFTREGYWPWEKQVTPQGGETIALSPFFMPRETKGVVVPPSDTLREKRIREVESRQLPTEEEPLLSFDRTVALFARDNTLVAKRPEGADPSPFFCAGGQCASERTVISFDAELRDVAFLPGRNDAALIAIQDGVFAIELDNRGTQNFQPVYRGIRPRIAFIEGTLYLRDSTSLFTLSLD